MSANRPTAASYRRADKYTPVGRNVLRYKKKKPSKHVCAECGAVLHGVPRGRPYEIGKLSKTAKRPNRPFGGHLCSSCTRKHFKNEARK